MGHILVELTEEEEAILGQSAPDGVPGDEFLRILDEEVRTGTVANPPLWWIELQQYIEEVHNDPAFQARIQQDHEAFMAMVRADTNPSSKIVN